MPNTYHVNKYLFQLFNENLKNSDSPLLPFKSTPSCNQRTGTLLFLSLVCSTKSRRWGRFYWMNAEITNISTLEFLQWMIQTCLQHINLVSYVGLGHYKTALWAYAEKYFKVDKIWLQSIQRCVGDRDVWNICWSFMNCYSTCILTCISKWRNNN